MCERNKIDEAVARHAGRALGPAIDDADVAHALRLLASSRYTFRLTYRGATFRAELRGGHVYRGEAGDPRDALAYMLFKLGAARPEGHGFEACGHQLGGELGAAGPCPFPRGECPTHDGRPPLASRRAGGRARAMRWPHCNSEQCARFSGGAHACACECAPCCAAQ